MDKINVFVIMPFEKEFFQVYDAMKNRFSSFCEFYNASDKDNQQNILRDIVQAINESDVVIANLTGLKPNIMYELGIAHTMNKKTIIITEDINSLPFDLKNYRARQYSTHFAEFADFLDYLEKNLRGVADGSVEFGNPVKDFSKNNSSNTSKKNIPRSDFNVSSIENDGDFLDYIAQLQSNSEKFVKNIDSMTIDLNELGEKVATKSAEFEKINKQGGSISPSFMKKETKKIAGYIESFAAKLAKYNAEYVNLWEKIHNDSMGLIKNKFASNDVNKQGLTEFLQSFENIKNPIEESNMAIAQMKSSCAQYKGIERNLTHAIISLENSLDNYLKIMNDIRTSVNKILQEGAIYLNEEVIQAI